MIKEASTVADKRFLVETAPVARTENVIICGNARFTVLTDRLIRCEYAPRGVFVDRASQSVFFRDFPKAEFAVSRKDGKLVIDTAALQLTYGEKKAFAGQTLQIALKGEPGSVWHYGETVENLGGTCQTLDQINGETALDDGVCSRYGYAILDDSHTMLLNEEGWVETREKETVDLYFFGYGYAYLDAVKDYYRLTGVPPLLPAYALGNWWSRYYKYTQQEYLSLMDRFQKEDIPFSVGVVDMDWHITKVPEEHKSIGEDDVTYSINSGWTGYTWNAEYFPDYKAFLTELHNRNLKTSLNLHPHAGVLSHEAMYEDMAKAMGMTPEKGKRIPFDILSPRFMGAYFDILHHPYEQDGVDFWWMDWQQGKTYWWIHEENRDGKMQDEREVLDPLWMLNHLHIQDISRNGKRPMFFSRFSGPGSQRYPVGFSGDTIMTWDSLRFQPYFTATASNVGYSWWSHDIGGHMCGYRDEDLTLRWLQYGVFSPINRLHSSGNDSTTKEPWTFGEETERLMGKWLRFRHQLFPYLYTMNYRNHHDLEPLVQPMYYAYPKCDDAYRARNQYFFGSELLVAPITVPTSPISHMGSTKVFFPAGKWFDFFDGSCYESGKNRMVKVCRDRKQYPVFAKAGAIVPLRSHKAQDNTLCPSENMEVVVFPGASNTFNLYEDAGDGQAYKDGAYAVTEMKLDHRPEEAVFVLGPARGDVALVPAQRTWKLCFRGFSKNCRISANLAFDVAPVYVPETATWEVTLTASVGDKISVVLTGENLLTDNGDRKERCYDILRRATMAHDRLCHLQWNIRDAVSYKDAYVRVSTGVSSLQEQELVDALLEQLLLAKY